MTPKRKRYAQALAVPHALPSWDESSLLCESRSCECIRFRDRCLVLALQCSNRFAYAGVVQTRQSRKHECHGHKDSWPFFEQPLVLYDADQR